MHWLILLSFLLAGCAVQPSQVAPVTKPDGPFWEQTAICRKAPIPRFCMAQVQEHELDAAGDRV
jgi:hypothetical protein